MTKGKKTKFTMRLPHLNIELSGEKTFVEELYKSISRDFAPLVDAAKRGGSAHQIILDKDRDSDAPKRNDYTWVYLCTNFFNKVYVMEKSGLEASMLGAFVDFDRLRRVYVDREDSPVLESLAQTDRTLWAEFTEEGKAALRGAISQSKPA